MAKRMPPLNPLRVFSVVARTQNVTSAARELHVSQSAVSRQIGVLEAFVGVELLKRERHGVTLTGRGQAYADEIGPAFDKIASATETLMQPANQNVLRVRTYTTFAAKWLIPRLPDFKRAHPAIDVRLLNAVPDVNFERDAVDVAIQFGDGTWPRMLCDLVVPDQIEPVCSPDYLKRAPKDRESLLGGRLLSSHYRRTDWDDWLQMAGYSEHARSAERMSFSSSILTWQAALDGLGLAIGQAALLSSEYRSGRLVRPFALPLRRDKGHFLVRPLEQREPRKVRAFRTWLLSIANAA